MKHKLHFVGLGLTLMALVGLCWPATSPPEPAGAGGEPFRWDRDALFADLERLFVEVRDTQKEAINVSAEQLQAHADELLAQLQIAMTPPQSVLRDLETSQFELAALAAAHPELLPQLAGLTGQTRRTTLDAVARWHGDTATIHRWAYRIVQGGRTALEEALAQAGSDSLPAISAPEQVPSQTPSAEVHGVVIHSGDILLSRGGAPSSALIARGNDFPGNFSHAALVHVTDDGSVNVVESLIERGLVVTPARDYLHDKKLRIMVLRIRPQFLDNPMLPHLAATAMLERAQTEKVSWCARATSRARSSCPAEMDRLLNNDYRAHLDSDCAQRKPTLPTSPVGW